MSVKAFVPATLWTIVSKFAEKQRLKPIQVWELLLEHMTSMIEEGQYDFMGPSFKRVIDQLVADDQIGASGLPAITNPAILHRSPKNKSGFEGIYANGKGYRASSYKRGPNGTEMIHLGTFKTAEQAAWARYLYHKKNGIAYGAAALAIETERNAHPDLWIGRTDAEVLEELNITYEMGGLRPLSIGIEESTPQPEEARKPIEIAGGVDPSIFGH